MILRFVATLGLLGYFATPSACQDLYIPYNVAEAYEAGSRNFNGVPGQDYFQNKSSYRIKAEFDPHSKILKGKEWITYYNNSPDVLTRLVVKLYQDYFIKGGIRDRRVDPGDLHDGTRIKYLSVNDTIVDVSDPLRVTRRGTNMIIMLEDYLLQDKSLKIIIEWEFNFPRKTTERYGTYNKSSFFVAYWYPQIAVYDDIDGWDMIEYNGTQEFYNDFNDFHCEIKVPSEYLVWSTGDWLNPAEILKDRYLQRYEDVKSSDEVIHIIAEKDLDKPSKNKRINVFKFEAFHVTDFAFAVSKKYLWDARSIRCVNSDKRVCVQAVYSKNADEFKKVTDITAKSVYLFADSVIGLPFPFDNIIAFNGSDGMEFPMMINEESFDDYYGTVYVTSHETGHMYFPFTVGTNEKKYAWMDEGLVTLLPKEIEKALIPGKDPYENLLSVFRVFSGNEEEIPLMVPSDQLRGITYQINAYYRSSVAFYYLRQYLGNDIFRKALQEFIIRWSGKHPTPYDFFFTFNFISGENLNWFWNAWFFKPGWVDISIADVDVHGNTYNLVVENSGGLPVPLKLSFVYADGETETVNIKADCWKENYHRFNYTRISRKEIKEVYINEKYLPDKNPQNNYYLVAK